MTISDRDRRALTILGVTTLPGLIWMLWPADDSAAKPAATAIANTPAGLAQQLQRLRNKQSQIPAKQGLLNDLEKQAGIREKGLIIADTLPQAQAILAGVVRQIARQDGFDIRNVTIAQPTIFGGEYGQVSVQISSECSIEQVVNFLADLTKRPELMATEDMRINMSNPKSKSLQFSATISGLVPKRLVPEKRPGIL